MADHPPPSRLCIIAGGGMLPYHVYSSCLKAGIAVHIIALEGEFEEILQTTSSSTYESTPPTAAIDFFPAYRASKIIARIKQLGIEHVTFAGRIRRPNHLAKLILDPLGRDLLKRLTIIGRNTDDTILRTVIAIFEENGLKVLPPESLSSEIRIEPGPLTICRPQPADLETIGRGCTILNTLAPFDIGQGLIIASGGLVIGIEAAEGTQKLIRRCGEIIKQKHSPISTAILVKLSKRGQDKRIDLPAIGPDTISACRESGVIGIAVAAGESVIVERSTTLALADEGGLFVYGL